MGIQELFFLVESTICSLNVLDFHSLCKLTNIPKSHRSLQPLKVFIICHLLLYNVQFVVAQSLVIVHSELTAFLVGGSGAVIIGVLELINSRDYF